MKPLVPGYESEVGRLEKDRWHENIRRFVDLSLYQTWSYGAVQYGPGAVDHMILRNGQDVVACAQVRIATIPGLRWGAAYVRWGPLWKAG